MKRLTSRIIGGKEYDIGTIQLYQFVVFITKDNYIHYTGSVLSKRHVLTAAHGIIHLNESNNFNNYKINYCYPIWEIRFHSEFKLYEESSNSVYIADIAVIHVSNSVNCSIREETERLCRAGSLMLDRSHGSN